MNQKNGAELRQAAAEIFQAALRAVDPAEAVRRHFSRQGKWLRADGHSFDLSQFRRVLVVGAGKAGAPMAGAVEEVLGERITTGWVNVKYGHLAETRKVHLHEAGHPFPDEAGLQGTQAILELLQGAGEDDLVICLISGGGSALLPLPVAGVSLEEKQEFTRLLLASGADIREINILRKHLSKVKGGGLARAAYPAAVATLILSDVIGDPLDVIASGPTVPDGSSYAQALQILERHRLVDEVPVSILRHLKAGIRGEVPETPKEDDPIFARVTNLVVGSNLKALLAAQEKALELGFRSLILSSSIEGEAREVAVVHAALAREIRMSGHPLLPPACLISGGETTVTIRGQGRGGRNMEFALAAAIKIAGLQDVVLWSAGTDGTDGPTDAAGAVADGGTLERAVSLGLDPWKHLEENDSYPFFEKLGSLVITGPTNTNVMDIRLVLVG
ncbi:MAG: glycerate kinase [candidate division NC10 bacterium]|nr:glycerate kinase [candidate division NC10 bacterium]